MKNMKRTRALLLYVVLHFTTLVVCELTWNEGNALNKPASTASAEFTTYDVTVVDVYSADGQRLTGTLTDHGHHFALSIQLTAFKQSFVLDLQLSRYMFSQSYVEKSVSSSHEVYHAVNHKKYHCYYTGVVRNESHSTAAVSTCRGVVGYFVAGNEAYHIEPHADDIVGLHSVYRESDSTLPAMMCGYNDTSRPKSSLPSSWRSDRETRSVQDTDGTTRVVELYVVNDHKQYISQGRDVQKVATRAKNIINIVNSLYQPFDIYIMLVGMETWYTSDRIRIEAVNSTGTLNRFVDYRRQVINRKHSNDNAQLITNVRFSNQVVGKAHSDAMCTYRYSAGMNSDLSTQPGRVGTTMAHEMGHNFGLQHDDARCNCGDPDGYCIMSPTIRSTNPATTWSQCSKEQLKDALAHGLDYCLYNVPDSYLSPYCGNGIRDDGEECDCGQAPSSECNAACCNSTTCKLVEPATCSAGSCCDISTCQLKAKATECRRAASDCDVSEHCDGKNAFCPPDVYKRDGIECTVNAVSAYCYRGKCRSLESQCQLLWGTSSKVSDRRCFSYFNIRGKSNGHCGVNWADSTYKACPLSDIMCGQLHCSPAQQLVYFKPALTYMHVTSYVTSGGLRHHCDCVIIDVGAQRQDPGMAPNGAKCGDGKMCLDQKCVDVSTVAAASCPNDCNSHGVCDNLGQCHCDDGYIQSSSGCSKEHGNNPVTTIHTVTDAGRNTSFVGDGADSRAGTNTGLIVGLCILFVVILSLLVLAAVCGYRHKERLRRCWRSNMAKIIPNKGSQAANSGTSSPKDQTTPGVVVNQSDAQVGYLKPTRTAPPNPTRTAPPRPPLRPTASPPVLPPQRAPYVISVPHDDSSVAGPVPTRPAPVPISPRYPWPPTKAVPLDAGQLPLQDRTELPPRPAADDLARLKKDSQKPAVPPKPKPRNRFA